MSYNENYTMGQGMVQGQSQRQSRNRVRTVEIDADQVIIRTNRVRIEGARKGMGHGYSSMDVGGAGESDYGDYSEYDGNVAGVSYGNEYDGNVAGTSYGRRHCKGGFWL